MNKDLLYRANQFSKETKKKRHRKRIMSLVSVFVVLCTLNALMIPAITMGKQTTCGKEEHIHHNECYSDVTTSEYLGLSEIHQHNENCYADGVLICNYRYTYLHSHNEYCYDSLGTLACPLGEICQHKHEENCFTVQQNTVCTLEEDYHIHDGNCFKIENGELICTEEETEGHTHAEGCYQIISTELICQTEETEGHAHGEECFHNVDELTCDIPEVPAHIHTVECYQDNKEVICGSEEIQPHVHNTECYQQIKTVICEKAEKADGHAHTERCYEETKNLICTEKEIIPHSHTEECYSENGALLCGLEEIKEHIHSENCTKFVQQEEKVLICDAEEHTHTDECYPPEEDDSIQLVCIREEHIHTETCGENCEKQEHLHTEDCYISDDIEKEDASTEDAPPLDMDLYDISNGPVVIVQVGERITDGDNPPTDQAFESDDSQKMMAFSTRATSRGITELKQYVLDKGGTLTLSLKTANGQKVPTDENGNYVVNTTDSYTLEVYMNMLAGMEPGRYQYKLPDGITLDGGIGPLIVYEDNEPVKLGEWEVSENGYIVLNFNDDADNYTHVTISALMAIHFSDQQEEIDFDGLIKVDIIPPPHLEQPTEITKMVVETTANEISWKVEIKGNKDSNIPGNMLIDSIITESHSYTEKDMANGIKIGVSHPDETGKIVDYHSWIVRPGDPGLIWNENEWHYTIPEYCKDCNNPLGNENWIYYVEYTSTPKYTEINGILHYRNKVSVDGETAFGDAYFNQHTHRADILKEGRFQSYGENGGFIWDIYVSIPGIEQGEKAALGWYIQDEMEIQKEWKYITGINNGLTQATVTAFYKGKEITVQPYSRYVEDEPFVYSIGYPGTGDISDPDTPVIYFLCKCNCNENTCRSWGRNEETGIWRCCSSEAWYNDSYCRCWTEEEDVTFTVTYITTEADKENLFSNWGGQNYNIFNVAHLTHLNPVGWVPYDFVDQDVAEVQIPGVFKKELHKNFDGYTANYIITVNEAKLNLTNGAPLQIHDAMTDTLAYVNGSLLITAEDINGKITTLTEGIDYSMVYDGSGNHVAANGDKKHVLDIKIYNPQPVKYTLDYDATLIFPDDATEEVKYSNSATIQLWGDSITSGTEEVTFTRIDMSAQRYSVKIKKSSASTDELLQGARFGLYNQHGGVMAKASTDENGEILFQTNVTEGIVLSEHELYYIQEIAAPEGYMLDDSKHWFCFCKCTSENECTFDPKVDFSYDRVPQNQMVYELVNSTYGYELPETGGAGTQQYTAGGLFLITSAIALLFYRSKRYRKEDITSS